MDSIAILEKQVAGIEAQIAEARPRYEAFRSAGRFANTRRHLVGRASDGTLRLTEYDGAAAGLLRYWQELQKQLAMARMYLQYAVDAAAPDADVEIPF